MRNTASILLHPSRLHQLRLIAQALGRKHGHEVAVTEVIERFITDEIRKGTIPDDIPGLEITREINDGMPQLAIRAGDLSPVVFTWPEIEALSGRLFSFCESSAEKIGGFDIRPEAGGRWLFGRVGRGFVHVLSDAEGRPAKFTATRAMMRDLDAKLGCAIAGTTMAERAKSMQDVSTAA